MKEERKNYEFESPTNILNKTNKLIFRKKNYIFFIGVSVQENPNKEYVIFFSKY